MADPSFDRKLSVVLRETSAGIARGARQTWPVTRSVQVVITEAGIAVGDDQFIRREDILHAYFQPRIEGRGSVRCIARNNDLILDSIVQNEEEADQLLRALGRDVAQSRVSFMMESPIGPIENLLPFAPFALILLFVLLAVVPSSVRVAVAVLSSWVAIPVIAAAALGQRVEVGVDGITLRWGRRVRFIGYEKMTWVASFGVAGVRIGLVDGKRVKLTASADSVERRFIEQAMARDAFVARIEAARAAFARRAGSELTAIVARGTRPIAEWRTALTRIGADEEGGYRDGATRKEDLWRVVEDAGAPEDARVGAAIALRGEDGAAPRLRIAADAVASPKLRVALEAAANPAVAEAALDEALEAVTAAK